MTNEEIAKTASEEWRLQRGKYTAEGAKPLWKIILEAIDKAQLETVMNKIPNPDNDD